MELVALFWNVCLWRDADDELLRAFYRDRTLVRVYGDHVHVSSIAEGCLDDVLSSHACHPSWSQFPT